MDIIAIDPGPVESAYVLIDANTKAIEQAAKIPNNDLLWLPGLLANRCPTPMAAIEMVTSYGMPVGAEVFDTCVWIGRFTQVIADLHRRMPEMVTRSQIKLHHCHNSRARDSNIRQALVDRFAYGQPNHGKGTKADPGWFYGVSDDIWQAYALAVYVADRESVASNHRPLMAGMFEDGTA